MEGRSGDDAADEDGEDLEVDDDGDGPRLSSMLLIPRRDPPRLCRIIAGDFNSCPFDALAAQASAADDAPLMFERATLDAPASLPSRVDPRCDFSLFWSFRVKESRTALDNDTSEEDMNDCDVLWFENESLR